MGSHNAACCANPIPLLYSFLDIVSDLTEVEGVGVVVRSLYCVGEELGGCTYLKVFLGGEPIDATEYVIDGAVARTGRIGRDLGRRTRRLHSSRRAGPRGRYDDPPGGD